MLFPVAASDRALLSDTLRALGEDPDVLLCSHLLQRPPPTHAFIFCSLRLHSVYISQSENQFLFQPPPSLCCFLHLKMQQCNQISWIKMSGLKMGDISANSHGSACEIKWLVEIMGMWIWSVHELLMVCFGRLFLADPPALLRCRQKWLYSELHLWKKLKLPINIIVSLLDLL